MVVISSLELSPHRSTAVAEVRLPGGITDVDSCQPATIDLGLIAMSPVCDFYVDAPDQAYGPWLLGDTGMVIEGTGYVLDLSTATSPAPWPPSWRGLALGAGTATGEKYVPDPCNTGYLRGHYTYSDAIVISTGFFGSFYLAERVSFGAINPLGQTFTFDDGAMDVWYSQIVRGELRNGWTDLPVDAVCEGKPGRRVRTPISVVSIQPDLDLGGVRSTTVTGRSAGASSPATATRWWRGPGSSAPATSTSPRVRTSLSRRSPRARSRAPPSTRSRTRAWPSSRPTTWPASRSRRCRGALVFSPDRPGGRGNPIKLDRLQGWIRVGITGVDGALSTYRQAQPEELGDPNEHRLRRQRPVPLDAVRQRQGEPAGRVRRRARASTRISPAGSRSPTPCNIPRLDFAQMKLTSTACLVGGEVVLPTAGVPLEYWDLQLVPTGPPDQSGVVSVRTGRVLLTAAGIAEPLHFARPFGLTWGEMLADGNLGQLYLDFNNWGQRFDGLVFNPHELTLSTYDPQCAGPVPRRVGTGLLPVLRAAPGEHPRRTGRRRPAPGM